MNDYYIARIAHEVNRAYCAALGDNSQPTLEDAPEWQREAVMNGVRNILYGTVVTPEESHRSWVAKMADNGWVYGPVKDTERKQHPCMRPYTELPLEQRVKDHLFLAVVQALGNW